MNIFSHTNLAGMQDEDTMNGYGYLFTKPIYAANESITPSLTGLDGAVMKAPQLLFVLRNALNQPVTEEDFEMLKKMADWTGLTRNDVACYLMQDAFLNFNQINAVYGFSYFICFGAIPADLGLHIDHKLNVMIRFMESTLLFTAPFAEVQKNEKLKKEFFHVAEKMFSHFRKKRS